MNKLYLSILMVSFGILIMFTGFVNAVTLGTFQQNNCIQLKQTCGNCTFVNVTSVIYPNSSQALGNVAMTKIGTEYNYTFCLTSPLGEYIYNTLGNPDAILVTEPVTFLITSTGEQFDINQSIILVGQLVIIALFFGMGLTFKKERWKLRTFFFIIAMLMGIVCLNSIRIILGSSSSLSLMGSTGLWIGIIVVLFMVLYLFVFWLIETFNYFKDKRKMRWDVGSATSY